MILPLPEKFKIENEIHTLFINHRDSIETCARYLSKDVSNISRQLNPGDRMRPNPFFTVMEILWALDCFCPELADALWSILRRERERWRVNCPNSVANCASLLDDILDELKDVVLCDMTDASLEEKETEALQLRDAVDAKVNSIRHLRAARVGFISNSVS